MTLQLDFSAASVTRGHSRLKVQIPWVVQVELNFLKWVRNCSCPIHCQFLYPHQTKKPKPNTHQPNTLHPKKNPKSNKKKPSKKSYTHQNSQLTPLSAAGLRVKKVCICFWIWILFTSCHNSKKQYTHSAAITYIKITRVVRISNFLEKKKK